MGGNSRFSVANYSALLSLMELFKLLHLIHIEATTGSKNPKAFPAAAARTPLGAAVSLAASLFFASMVLMILSRSSEQSEADKKVQQNAIRHESHSFRSTTAAREREKGFAIVCCQIRSPGRTTKGPCDPSTGNTESFSVENDFFVITSAAFIWQCCALLSRARRYANL
jgi:hypothetical protein